VADAAAELIFEKQTEAVAERGVFRIALSGGNTPKLLFEKLAADEWREEMAWEHWEVYWVDERAVPPDHPDSNYRLAFMHLLKHVPARKIFPMLSEDSPHFTSGGLWPSEMHGELNEAAERYQELLIKQFGEPTPAFDMILLGMGTDGHTASIFPSDLNTTPQSPTGELKSSDRLVISAHAPNQKIPHRLTFTYRVLNAARTIVFLITGEDKAARVRDVLLNGDPSLPATHVKPEDGECYWILDDAAAHLLE
jgi:6-phosphogluconolactonase